MKAGVQSLKEAIGGPRSKLYTQAVSNAFGRIARSPWKVAMAGMRRMRRRAVPVAEVGPALRRSCSNPTLECDLEGKGRIQSAMVAASSGAKKLERLSKQLCKEKLEEERQRQHRCVWCWGFLG